MLMLNHSYIKIQIVLFEDVLMRFELEEHSDKLLKAFTLSKKYKERYLNWKYYLSEQQIIVMYMNKLNLIDTK